MSDQDTDDVADGQISDSEADRVMINYTEHFDGSIGRTSDDIREELEEEEVEESVMTLLSVLPESQQGEEEIHETFVAELEDSMEVRFTFKIRLFLWQKGFDQTVF